MVVKLWRWKSAAWVLRAKKEGERADEIRISRLKAFPVIAYVIFFLCITAVSATFFLLERFRSTEASGPLTLTSIAPSSGSTAGGTEITITGTDFVRGSYWKQIGAGAQHTCAIASNDQVYCWGNNNWGQIGDNTSMYNRLVPTAVHIGAMPSLKVKKISVGSYHNCAIAEDDQAYCWGNNDHGQIGNNASGPRLIPTAILQGAMPSLKVKQISAGASHTCAIASNDQVYCWGTNGNGEIGDGTSVTGRPTPTAVSQGAMPSLSVKQLEAGESHSCAIAINDQVYCWGWNIRGQIGDGTSGTGSNRFVPTAVSQGARPNLTVKQINVGILHTCAIASDDQAYCWGENGNGQIGDGTSGNSHLVPTAALQGAMPGLGVKQLIAGGQHTCAIAMDNQAYCWGNDGSGQIGDGTSSGNRPTPTAVLQGSMPSLSVGQLAAGAHHTCTVASNYQAYCWGYNVTGQIGDNTSGAGNNRLVPTVIVNPSLPTLQVNSVTLDAEGTPASCINVNVINSTTLTCTTTAHAAGQVSVTISNGVDTITLPGAFTYKSLPTISSVTPNRGPTRGGTEVTITGTGFMQDIRWKQISTAGVHTCAIAMNDQAYCWGDNQYGQIGDNTFGTNRLTPTAVSQGAMPGLTVKQIVAGGGHTCAIANNDQAYCWGYNVTGQIGDGTSGADRLVPTAVSQGAMPGLAVKQISISGRQTCAIAMNDQAYCWGNNNWGQIGDDTSGADRLAPTAVSQGAMPSLIVKQISTGGMHTCAIAANDQLFCWGYNGSGQMGNSTYGAAGRPIPTAVNQGAMPSLAAKQVVSGANQTCAIAMNDQAYCWGHNQYGQLGDNTPAGTNRPAPVAVSQGAMPSLIVKQIVGIGDHTCAIASNDRAYCWGRNNFGQIGDNAVISRIVPTAVVQGAMPSFTVKQIVASNQTCAIASNDQVYCWGYNSYGQIGDNTFGIDRLIPTALSPMPVITFVTFDVGGAPAPCTNITVINATTLTCITSAHVAGTVDVSVSDGPDTVTLGGAFTYIPPPTISAITPNRGPIAGGTGVTITGTNFQQDANWKQIAAGDRHTCAIASNDQAYCWGSNAVGQIGDGTSGTGNIMDDDERDYRPTPTAVQQGAMPSLIVKQIVASGFHTCAIASNDQAYCWGSNSAGQIGDGTSGIGTNRLTPIAVLQGAMPSLKVKQIVAGTNNVCAIAMDDQAYCWGNNQYGQIGDGTFGSANNRLAPTAVQQGAMPSLKVKKIAVGSSSVCAIAMDDQAYCWGYNQYGQIGDGTSGIGINRLTPTAVLQGAMPSLKVKQIAAFYGSGGSTCAIAMNDRAYCWGNNEYGQIGDGTSGIGINRLTPTAVLQGAMPSFAVKKIMIGMYITCAIASDDQVYCWGRNVIGQIGDGTSGYGINRPVPTTVLQGAMPSLKVRQIAVGCNHPCVISSDDQIYCWGYNEHGQIGDDTFGTNRLVPTATVNPIPPTPLITSVTFDVDGAPAPCADIMVNSATTLTCITSAHAAGLVDVAVSSGYDSATLPGAFTYVPPPTISSVTPNKGPIAGGTGVTITGTNFTAAMQWKQVATNGSPGGSHTCAIANNDQVYCWGSNTWGQIGDSTSGINRLVPTAVAQGAMPSLAVKQIAVGSGYTCAIGMNDQAYCWGRNNYGQIGDNTSSTDRLVPTAVQQGAMPSLAVKQITANQGHTCAIAMNDQAFCWGQNHLGQIGDNTSLTDRLVPTAVSQGAMPSLAIKRITTGQIHTCAIASNDQAYCWGSNNAGEIGDNTSGSANSRLVPTAVSQGAMPNLSVTQITARGQHTCVIASNDQVYCWGGNTSGQIGNNTSGGSRLVPTAASQGAMPGLAVKQISAGWNFVCAMAINDQAFCWGLNDYGQVGDNTFGTNRLTPTAVSQGSMPSLSINQINAGYRSTCVIASNNQAYCWGNNDQGQIGDDTFGTDRLVPTAIIDPLTPLITSVIFDSSGTPAPCTSITVTSATALTCTTSAHSAALVGITINNGFGTATLANAFTYYNLSLSLSSNGTVVISAAPTVPASVASGNDVLTVTTNNPSGYTLSLSMSTNSTNDQPLRKDGTSTTYKIDPTTVNTLGTNQWGFSTTGLAGSWMAVPLLASPHLLKNSGVATAPSGEATTVYFGVRPDINLPVGVYSVVVTYTLVAN